jgi:hypothetical protein
VICDSWMRCRSGGTGRVGGFQVGEYQTVIREQDRCDVRNWPEPGDDAAISFAGTHGP